VHPNFFGMCAITAIGLLLHLRHRVPAGCRWLLWVALGANLAATVMSGSRAAVVLVVLLAVLYPVLERSALTAYAVVAIGVTAVLLSNKILGLAGQGSALERLNGDATASTSDSVRSHALDSGLSALQAHPLLGNGFENALAAHNIYLQVAESAGIIGLIGFLLMFAAIIGPLFQRGPMHRLGYGALAYAVDGLMTASLWDRMVWAGLSLSFLAVLWPAGSDTAEEPAAEPEPRRLAAVPVARAV
jgi:O-antigen ligase